MIAKDNKKPAKKSLSLDEIFKDCRPVTQTLNDVIQRGDILCPVQALTVDFSRIFALKLFSSLVEGNLIFVIKQLFSILFKCLFQNSTPSCPLSFKKLHDIVSKIPSPYDKPRSNTEIEFVNSPFINEK